MGSNSGQNTVITVDTQILSELLCRFYQMAGEK